jgi:hypothetical protein
MRKKRVWYLQQHAGAVTGFFITADRTAMLEVGKYLQSLFDYVVTLFAVETHYESDSTGIVFVARIV